MHANTDDPSGAVYPPLPLVGEAGAPHPGAIPPSVRAVLGAWALAVTGEDRIEAWAPALLAGLDGFYAASPATADKAIKEVQRFLRYLFAHDVVLVRQITPQITQEFFWAARPGPRDRHRQVSPATARNRRWAVGALFRVAEMLGLDIDSVRLLGDPLGSTPPQQSARPLTPDEAQAVKDCADAGLWASTRPVMVALAHCGGSAAEIAATSRRDIDLEQRTVRFGGTAARTNPLDEWASRVLAEHLAHLQSRDAAGPLCVDSALPTRRAAHSITVRLREVLIDAGIAGRPGVTAASIRLTAAAAIAQQHGIAAAAKFLGSRSLDRTAAALRWDWERADDG